MQANAAPLQLVNGMGLVPAWTAMIRKAALREAAKVAPQVPHRIHGRSAFDRPVFIVSPPRSGSSLLFETLAQSPDVFTIGGESHRMLEVEVAAGKLGTIERGYLSNRLDATDATPEIVDELKERYYAAMFDRDGARPSGSIRLLEKTPKNALRVPFLAKVFPDARFVYLYREPREVLASMLEAWESGRFVTYPELPDWTGLPWSMVLVPGWRDLIGKPLADVVAAQWQATTSMLLDDLEDLPRQQCLALRHDKFIADPEAVITNLCANLDLRWDRALDTSLPPARYTVSAPRPEKWRARERDIRPLLESLAGTIARAEHIAAFNAIE